MYFRGAECATENLKRLRARSIVCVLYLNLNVAESVIRVPSVLSISVCIDKFQCEERREYN